MEELLEINEVVFPQPEGSYSVTYVDKTNEYESESGEMTVEVIREKVCSISVSYNGLMEDRFRELVSAIKTVNTVSFYDPTTGQIETKTMKADANRIKTDKKYYKYGRSMWSLSFSLEEM